MKHCEQCGDAFEVGGICINERRFCTRVCAQTWLNAQPRDVTRDWERARMGEAFRLWEKYREDLGAGVIVVHEDDDPKPEGVVTPRDYQAYLERNTGIPGWRVTLEGGMLMVTPPYQYVEVYDPTTGTVRLGLLQHSISVRKLNP